MSMTKINFFFNGKEYYTDTRITLTQLVNYFSYDTSVLILEYNNFICNKQNWNNIFINKRDRIEIITIVGGG
jgi:thiamine biosynthesis protein ThiS